MKKLFLLLVLAIVAIAANAQRGSVISLEVDTLQGAETVNFEEFELRANYDLVNVTAICDNVGGTSDGTLALYGSLDGTNWVFINGVGAGILTASPKASITGADLNQVTITDGLVANWVVNGVPYRNFKITGVGTADDTTKVTITYMYK